MLSSRKAARLTFTLVSVLAIPLHAQTVKVLVRSDHQIEDGIAILALDSTGAVRVSRISASGEATLPLPFAGEWTVRAEHLGYGTAEATVSAAQGAQIAVTLHLKPAPLPVPGLQAIGERRCEPAPSDAEVVEFWLAARAVLADLPRTERREAQFHVAIRRRRFENGAYYRRDQLLEEGSLPRGALIGEADTVWSASPIPPELADVERILTNGFIVVQVTGGEELYLYDFLAPLPSVLLSDGFVASHCFRLVRDREHQGMVGLAFEPNRLEVYEYDVTGTLWLPETVSTWPWIEFRYTKVPEEQRLREYTWGVYLNGEVERPSPLFYPPSKNDRFGGRADLAYIDGVGWTISHLRMQWPRAFRRSVPALRSEAEWKADHPEEIEPRDVVSRTFWLLTDVVELTIEVLEVRVAGVGRRPQDVYE